MAFMVCTYTSALTHNEGECLYLLRVGGGNWEMVRRRYLIPKELEGLRDNMHSRGSTFYASHTICEYIGTFVGREPSCKLVGRLFNAVTARESTNVT